MVFVNVTEGVGQLESIDDLDTERWMNGTSVQEVITDLEDHCAYFDVMPGSRLGLC